MALPVKTLVLETTHLRYAKQLSGRVPLLTIIAAAALVTLYVVALLACWLLTFVGFPGNWLLCAIAAAQFALVSPPSIFHMTGGMLVALGLVAVLGEVAEFAAAALGTARKQGSRKSAVWSLIASIAGGIAGAFVGLPIPLVGSVVGALVGACLGALFGAAAGERLSGRDWRRSLDVGLGALYGRLLGSLAKTLAGAIMVGTMLARLIV